MALVWGISIVFEGGFTHFGFFSKGKYFSIIAFLCAYLLFKTGYDIATKESHGRKEKENVRKCIECGSMTYELVDKCESCGGKVEEIKGFFERHPQWKDK